MIVVVVPRLFAAWLAWIRSTYVGIVSMLARWFGLNTRPTTPSRLPEAEQSIDKSRCSRAQVSGDLTVIPVMAQSISHHQYLEILWTADQASSHALLLDLSRVRVLKRSFFDVLATGWSTRRVVKLGVQVAFEQWAGLYREIAPHQRHLKSKGVELMLFYEDQDYGIWYREGRVVHNVESVINKLCTVSALSMRWPLLLDAAASLLEGYGSHRRAEALVRLSQLALDCGADTKALDLAHESLLYYKALSPELECRVRRVMGEALVQLGQIEIGTRCIEHAIEIGREGGAREEAAGAAYALGLHAAYGEDYPHAEEHYQQALRLHPHEPSEFLGRIHAALSVAMFRQGKDKEAQAHAELSYAMRRVSASSSTAELERSRALLSYMLDIRKLRASSCSS